MDTPASSSQRTKKKPNWCGQNVMVQKVEKQTESEADDKSETKTKEELRRELEVIPNFLEMTPEEIQNWINESNSKQKTKTYLAQPVLSFLVLINLIGANPLC